MPGQSDIRVLITGDDEADLGVVSRALEGRSEVVPGLASAVAALRLREFGVLVADVGSPQDALVLLRAARRARPPVRAIVLAPAGQSAHPGGWDLVSEATFDLLSHPTDSRVLQSLVDEARADYLAARDGKDRRRSAEADDPEALGWLLAERRLTGALRRALVCWSTRSQVAADDALTRGVEAVARAMQGAQATPDLLLAIADALDEDLNADMASPAGDAHSREVSSEAA